ncbi:MAG: hypothetical protein RLZZ347_238 [Candidatus Parcubacteria bacterium]
MGDVTILPSTRSSTPMASTLPQNEILLTDEAVLAQSVTDPNAFEILVSRYQEAFLRKLRGMRLSDESAEDIVQDAFVKIYLNAGKFKKVPGASFKSWGYRILINTALTALGKDKREKLATVDLDPEVVEQMGSADSEFEKKWDKDYFLSIVSKIPVTLGRTLTLAFEGKTAEDIAELEQTTIEAVRTRLSRAKVEFGKVRDSAKFV